MEPIRDNRKVRPVLPVVVLSSISHEIVWVTVSVLPHSVGLCSRIFFGVKKKDPVGLLYSQLWVWYPIIKESYVIWTHYRIWPLASWQYITVQNYNVYIIIFCIGVCRRDLQGSFLKSQYILEILSGLFYSLNEIWNYLGR